jgi:hypothetical protein
MSSILQQSKKPWGGPLEEKEEDCAKENSQGNQELH